GLRAATSLPTFDPPVQQRCNTQTGLPGWHDPLQSACPSSTPGRSDQTPSQSRRTCRSRLQESPSEGEEEPAAAGAERRSGIRRAVEPSGEPLAGAPKAQIPRRSVATWLGAGNGGRTRDIHLGKVALRYRTFRYAVGSIGCAPKRPEVSASIL